MLLEIDSTAYLLFLPFLHRGLLLHRGLPLHRVPDLLHHELLALLLHRGLHHGLSRPCYPDCGERLELVLMLLKNVHRLIHVTFEPTIALILSTHEENTAVTVLLPRLRTGCGTSRRSRRIMAALRTFWQRDLSLRRTETDCS